MKTRMKAGLGICAFVVFVAATQYAVRGIHNPTGNTGWLGTELAGVEGWGETAVFGRSTTNHVGRLGSATSGAYGANPDNSATGALGTPLTAVWGLAQCGTCLAVGGTAIGDALIGVSGTADGPGTTAVKGNSLSGYGVAGYTTDGTGVYGNLAPGGGGHAGWFEGRMHVNGALSKSSGSFKIDHPLDPANRYLSHSFVESPDMKNIYDGVVTLEADGTATIELPEWFEALNKDFRYQLTCIGENAPVYIAEKIHDNKFRIAGGYAGMEVSWQVTGSRKDVYAEAHPIPVEELKPPHEVGRYLHPELYGQPVTQRVGYVQAQQARVR